ncbi:MAG TPA: DUF4124 domain-containing protein [Gallionellaceae bacterium]
MKTLFLLLASLVAANAFAATYKWTDAAGEVHYTDKPPPAGTSSIALPVAAPEGGPAEMPPVAQLDDVAAVPYLDDYGRDAYRKFLRETGPRAFVLCKDGRHSFFTGASYAEVEVAIKRAIESNKRKVCRTYAIANQVVW